MNPIGIGFHARLAGRARSLTYRKALRRLPVRGVSSRGEGGSVRLRLDRGGADVATDVAGTVRFEGASARSPRD